MKKLYYFLLLLLFISGSIFFHSCKKDTVDQNKIYTVYELCYNANTNMTYAMASFQENGVTGTFIQLKSPSQVVFNGSVLSYNSTQCYYESEFSGLVSSGTFTWTDANGLTKTNPISVTPIAYPASLTTINRNSNYTMSWVGDSISANQSVVLTMTSVSTEGINKTFTQNVINSKSITLSASQLQEFDAGTVQLSLYRQYEPALTQQTAAGGKIAGVYGPVNKSIQLQ